MAYRSTSAALPQNSVTPAPANPDSDARILATKRAINEGRARIYSNTPSPEAFIPMGPRVTANAAHLLAESDAARQSIFGAGPPQSTVKYPGRAAPTVVPLNGSATPVSPPSATMPSRAPSGLAGCSPGWSDAVSGDYGGAAPATVTAGKTFPWWILLVAGAVLVLAATGKDEKKPRAARKKGRR
jgi:hypothetical protein